MSTMLVWSLLALLSGCGGGSSGGGQAVVPAGPPGTLDASFGTGGTVVTTGAAPLSANAMALQPDGKIVVAGSSGVDAGKTFYLARYNGDGSLDPQFGTGGSVTTVFDAVAGSEARAVVLQPDGKIVAIGGSNGACALARYNTDGSLDPGFGSGGILKSPSAHGRVECTDVAIQSDGKLVTALFPEVDPVLGQFQSPAGGLMRFGPDGIRDPSFGVVGEANIDCCGASRVVLRSDGTLVVAGTRQYYGIAPQFVGLRNQLIVAQFESAGILDNGFGDGGYASLPSATSFPCVAGGVAVDQDGKVVVVGSCPFFSTNRLIADGSVDSTFASESDIYNLQGNALSLQANGKPVVAGSTYLPAPQGPGTYSVALIRYNANGTRDSGFGNAGIAVGSIAGSAAANAVGVMPDGRIVVAGTTTDASSQQRIFVARYFGDPM